MERQREHSWEQPPDKAALSFCEGFFFGGKHSSDGSCVTWKKVWASSKASTTWRAVMSAWVFDILVLWGFTNKPRASENLSKGLTKNIWPHCVGLWKSPRKDCSVSKWNGIVWFFYTPIYFLAGGGAGFIGEDWFHIRVCVINIKLQHAASWASLRRRWQN